GVRYGTIGGLFTLVPVAVVFGGEVAMTSFDQAGLLDCHAVSTITPSGRRRPTSGCPRPSVFGGDHEGDPFCGTGARVVRRRGCAGYQGGPGWDVEVRI